MGIFSKKQTALPPSIGKIEERPALRIIRMQGSLDVSTEPSVAKFIRNLRAQPDFKFKNMIIDFKGVSYADSSAVARLVQTMFEYKKTGHRVGVIHLSETMRSLFEVMKIDTLVHRYPSEAEAVKALEIA